MSNCVSENVRHRLAGVAPFCLLPYLVQTLIVGLLLPEVVWGADRIVLRDMTAESGIDFQHTDGSGGKRYIVETVASGLATFDYNSDGLTDIYFLNGAPMRGTEIDTPPTNRLYRNEGGFRFVDVTREAGVGDRGFGLAVAVGDYDNDGHDDMYVSNYGPNVLYHNRGDGTFEDATESSGTGADVPGKVGAGAAFLDMDADGDLDLFVANYLEFAYERPAANFWHGIAIYPGPEQYPPMSAVLFENEGNGHFRNVSDRLALDSPWGRGMGIVCADYDNDGDTDIFVGNDGRPGNFLFQNDGTGHFEEGGGLSGTAFTAAGNILGSMGVDCNDYDNDGLLDFFVTSYQGQYATLFRNVGDGLFDDVTQISGAGKRSFNHVSWGCGFADFDNDGHKDIFYARGHLIDNVDQIDDSTSYLARPVLMHNRGDGTFEDVSDAAGDGMQIESVGRGAALEDLDNDGRIDVVILNSRRPPTILHNESKNQNHWLQVRLQGTRSNRNGVGARVIVKAGDLTLTDEVHSGRGYQSHFGSRLHFGLGTHETVERVEVRWIGGGVDVMEGLPVDQLVTIVEKDS